MVTAALVPLGIESREIPFSDLFSCVGNVKPGKKIYLTSTRQPKALHKAPMPGAPKLGEPRAKNECGVSRREVTRERKIRNVSCEKISEREKGLLSSAPWRRAADNMELSQYACEKCIARATWVTPQPPPPSLIHPTVLRGLWRCSRVLSRLEGVQEVVRGANEKTWKTVGIRGQSHGGRDDRLRRVGPQAAPRARVDRDDR